MKLEKLSKEKVRKIWMRSQGLDREKPFGLGHRGALKAVQQLGYVQIDTINVIERCHHHILFSRVPDYQKSDLHTLQTVKKDIFEYWTHALAFVPTADFKFHIPRMLNNLKHPGLWYKSVSKSDLQRVLKSIEENGALSVRDFKDDVLIEKEFDWGTRKPSKKALQLGFTSGRLTISERVGMLKKYELTTRHFGWEQFPEAPTEEQVTQYKLDRALTSQGCVSLDSICHLEPSQKAKLKKEIDSRLLKMELVEVQIEGLEKIQHWVRATDLKRKSSNTELVHILSPFDPLIIQRKRLKNFFDYQHLFEAYIPKEKRMYGYFALPVLIGDRVVSVIDLKTDRLKNKVLIQKWTNLEKRQSASEKKRIENYLHHFEKFQLTK